MIINSFKVDKISHWCIAISSCDCNLDLETDIKKYLQSNYAPENIYILRPDDGKKYSIAHERIPNFENIPVQEIIYKGNGELISNGKKLSAIVHKKLASEFYLYILKKHESVLKASNESYFVLPSKNYATHFIRIANIFKESQEINILSIFLLPYLKNNPEIIYCDTPTIFSLIYSCVLLKNKKDYNPRIKFYSPHSVSKDDVGNTENAIFIISTSINGTLPIKLNSQVGIDWSKIIVLYSFDTTKNLKYKALSKSSATDLLSDFLSLKPEIFKERFPNRTFEIKFEDDQFMPTAPTVSQIIINQEDAPKTLSDFMANYIKYDFISCYKGVNSKAKVRDIYFDVSKIFRNIKGNIKNHFEEKTNLLLINQLPINISAIIYVDKNESKYLADKIRAYYKKDHSKIVQSIFYQDLKFPTTPNNFPSCYLICSSCISEGKKIADISRRLRSQEDSQIIYFNGFVRCVDQKAYSLLKNNIKYGKYGFTTYSFITIDEIFLPNEDSDTISWEIEKNLINIILQGFDDLKVKSVMSPSTRKYFKNRFDDLNSLDGLVNNVFLNSKDGRRLMLNKNFAFFDFVNWKPKEIQQSKVYFTIISVLHNYRKNHNIKQTVYERSILSPENFNRYNDGIIQASILRSATSQELNYQIDRHASTAMITIIAGSIKDISNPDAAPYEFLMAICLGKLSLYKEDLQKLFNDFKNHKDNIIKTFFKIIESKFLT